MNILKKTLISCLLMLIIIEPIAVATSENKLKNNFTKFGNFLWGKPLPAQIHFYPVGVHFFSTKHPNNAQWLVAGNYNGVTLGTFVNSCNDRVFYQGIDRQVYSNEKFSIGYLLGVMEGYRGKCGLKDFGPIVSHDPGPLAILNFKYFLSDHLSIDVVTYGVGALGGVSFIF